MARTSAASLARSRRSPSPLAARNSRCWPMAAHSSSVPSPVEATVETIGGVHPSAGADRWSMNSRSRRVSAAPGRSALLTTKMSAASSRPALAACMASPDPGGTTTSVVFAAPATSISTWPTPTVSTSTNGRPAASMARMASGVAKARPPRWPRVAIDRMKTPWSVACDCMRTRSPRKAPPEKGDEGSTASTATSRSSARVVAISRSTSVDLPEPVGPVTPTV